MVCAIIFCLASKVFSQSSQSPSTEGQHSQIGTIAGYVTDAKTKEPLIGATIIIIELKGTGAASDENGRFRIFSPVGSYSMKVSLIGYQTIVKTDIIVTTGGETHVAVEMVQIPVELNQVTVTPDYFDKAGAENAVTRYRSALKR